MLERLFAKLAARKLAKELTDKETIMENGVEVKTPWYRSKAKVAAIVTVVVGAIEPVSKAFGQPVIIPTWVIEMLVGVGLYGIRDAIRTSK